MPNEHLKAPESGQETAGASELDRTGQLDKARETGAELNPDKDAESQAEKADNARKAIEHHADPAPKAEAEAAPAPSPSHPIAYINHHLNYSQTLASVQRKLSPVSRSFSKVIHTPAVEKTSEILENTVARPSLLLGTTWTALIVGSIFYLTAHHYGYALSGSELLFSFIVGAMIGLAIEGLFRAFKRR